MSVFDVFVWCRDCDGEDFLGCFDGGTEFLGTFATRAEAEEAGEREAEECWPWEYAVAERPADTPQRT